MNILFSGPYRQLDGWGEASRRYLKALLKTDHNINSQFIRLGQNIDEEFDNTEIIESEKNELNGVDLTIHYTLPSFIQRLNDCKNVCMFHYETTSPYKNAKPILEKMDGIIVSTHNEKAGILHKNVANIAVPAYPSEYKNLKKPKDNRPYTFLFMGEIVTRKNIHGLLRAYLSAFAGEDNVRLIIKGNVDEKDFHPFVVHTVQACRKSNMPNSLPEIEYIGNRLTREEVLELHNNTDCFISLSYGESICLPLLDSLMVGNKAIVTGDTGMDNFLTNDNVKLVEGFPTPCFCPRPPLPDIYTCEENWIEPNISQAIRIMRDLVDDNNQSKNPHQITVEKHSEKRIARELNEFINKL